MTTQLDESTETSAVVSPRRLTAVTPGASLADHTRAFGPLPKHSANALIAAVKAAGLTGRGGAAFPMHRKLSAVAAGSRPVVVANGAEGEPASSKDRALLLGSPHLVLDGIQLAARAVGATRGYLYLAAEPDLQHVVRAALAERTKTDALRIELVDAPDRFISGQETAAVAAVNGKAAVPRFAVPPVYERGVDGRPTLVQNVETLAQLALIARHGPDWFRSVGTADEPGTMLVTVTGAVARPQVVEVALGTPIRAVLERAGVTDQLGAVLVGGYHGAWLSPDQALARPLSNQALLPDGASVGAGILVALPASSCGVRESARVLDYLAGESARQCGPCTNGLPAIAGAMAELASGKPRREVVPEIERWAGLMPGRGACAHPDGTVRFLRSALQVFAREVNGHRRGFCSATSFRPVLPVPATADRGWR